mmetsp:Transcript_24808/g.58623  ORF Transcript_24808/g.58623 Transcript_24808/m.58623 type:complete len:89 (-) Transcript_24808:151-417(-)
MIHQPRPNALLINKKFKFLSVWFFSQQLSTPAAAAADCGVFEKEKKSSSNQIYSRCHRRIASLGPVTTPTSTHRRTGFESTFTGSSGG